MSFRTLSRIAVHVVLALTLALAAAPFVNAANAPSIAVTHWKSLLYGVPYAIADQLGLFGMRGIGLARIFSSEGGDTTLQPLLTGEAVFAEVSTLAVVLAIREGAPLVIVGGGARNVSEIVWVTRTGEPIRSIEDLRGKRVAYTTNGSVTHAVLLLSLERAEGIDVEDVTLVEAGGLSAGLAALRAGEVDAAPLIDPYWSEQRNDWQPVFRADEYVPVYMQTVLVTTREMVETHPELIAAIVGARREGVALLYANEGLAAQVLAQIFGVSQAAARESIANAASNGWWSFGGLDADGLRVAEEALRALTDTDVKVDWSSIIDQRFLTLSERITLP